jgi:hypothetical protein
VRDETRSPAGVQQHGRSRHREHLQQLTPSRFWDWRHGHHFSIAHNQNYGLRLAPDCPT